MKWWQGDEWAKAGSPMSFSDKTKGKQGRIRGESHKDGQPVRIYVGNVPWMPRI